MTVSGRKLSSRFQALSAAVLALHLAGCTSDPIWVHPTKDSDELTADLADCERFFGADSRGKLTCMTRKGWKQEKRK